MEAGEERALDIEQFDALVDYLKAKGHLGPAEQPRCMKLTGGVSNRTVLVERTGGESWVLKQALAQLRVPSDWFSSPERIRREAQALRWLRRLTPPGTIPPLLFEDQAHHLLAMQAVPQPHANWKALLLDGTLEEDHVDRFGRLLARIHGEAFHRRCEIASVFGDRSAFESLRLDPYYQYTADHVPAAAAFLRDLIDETCASQLTLVHGDYSPKNVLVHRGQLVLLDHEAAHYGDPAFDLGFSLTHLLSKAHHLVRKRQAFADAARRYWAVYQASLDGMDWAEALEARVVRHTLGCLLARVAGRSKLEYLSARARHRQREVVCALIDDPPACIEALTHAFVHRL